MAKCAMCHSRKGKRKCLIVDGDICTLCCGQTRKEETCQGCPFYKEPDLTRKYNEVPSYSTHLMAESLELQDYAYSIENALCAFDRKTEHTIRDDVALRILELLLDKYHFKDTTFQFDNDLVERGFLHVNEVIETDLSEMSEETLVKILGVIHRVAKRRTEGGREYLTFIAGYVEEGIAKGVRILPGLDLLS